MIERLVALCAALLICLLPAALVAASTSPNPSNAFSGIGFEMQVLSDRPDSPDLRDMPPMPEPDATQRPERRPKADAQETSGPAKPAQLPPANVVSGTASTYPGTAGFPGQATVALPGALGGRYTGGISGHATVCADRCARLPVVDWCQCYWGTAEQRVADLSHAAWPLITDQPLSRGLLQVRVIVE